MKWYLLTGWLCLPLFCFAQPVHETIRHEQIHTGIGERYARISIPAPSPETIRELLNAGIDLHCGARYTRDASGVSLEMECSTRELEQISIRGIPFEIRIEDVTAFYTERTRENLGRAKEELKVRKAVHFRNPQDQCGGSSHRIPENFRLGDFGGFLYYNEILAVLDTMAMLYPQLISIKKPLSDSLTTIEGRPVFWVRLSDNPEMDEDELEVLYTGLTHAREPAGTMSMLYFMWYLLENYGVDPAITDLVDHRELYFIPVVNPDGYVRNAFLAPEGGGMWRKNTRDNNADGYLSGIDGVDLNRNYGYLWGYDDSGSSSDPYKGNYRGTGPFSEPEIRMIREFVNTREFVVAIHNHAYGDELYYPWGFGDSLLHDSSLYARVSDLMTTENRHPYGQLHNTYWLGPINGGANDWFYGEVEDKPRIFSWIQEIGPVFWPDPAEIVTICENQLKPHLLAARIAGQCAIIHDLNPPALQPGENILKFRIENIGFASGKMQVRIVPQDSGITILEMPDDGVLNFQHAMETVDLEVRVRADYVPSGGSVAMDVIVTGPSGELTRSHIRKYLAARVVEFQYDDWKTDAWGPCHDPDVEDCMTDSPDGMQANAFVTIQLGDFLDLKDETWARASFLARWEIEPVYDFCQFQARVPGKPWQALCGQYTKRGSGAGLTEVPSPYAAQPSGEPVYDGFQNEWIREEVDLSAFIGFDSVELRFVAWSGLFLSHVVEDGFAFAQFRIYTGLPFHCSDGIQNIDETGTDCGGSQCLPCPSCNDGIKNGDEESTDCGGTLCEPCSTCDDDVQNGLETGIDCGGPVCAPCEPSCHDGILNGDEEDVDCGGSCLPCKTYCCDLDNKAFYELTPLEVHIFPNPAEQSIRLLLTDALSTQNGLSETFTYEILDVNGHPFLQGQSEEMGGVTVELEIPAGQMYFVRVIDAYGRCVIDRFFKGK